MDNTRKNIVADCYGKHRADFVAYARRRAGRADIAEDIVQDAFVRVLRSDKMVTEQSVGALVYAAVRNLTFDYWRHRAVVTAYEHLAAATATPTVNALDTALICARREADELLERGMAQLTPTKGEAYRLSLYDGMQVLDIVRVLGINYKTAESRLATARKQVRGYMRRMLA